MFSPNMRKIIIVGLCLAVAGLVVPNASAQRFDRGTVITVDKPFEVPGVAPLPPGTYVMRLVDVPGVRTVVQILNADETKSYGMVLGISDYRLEATDNTAISFYEAQPGAPVPMRGWFYPGYNHGVEFVYPKNRAAQIARYTREPVIAAARPDFGVEETPAELENEPLIEFHPDGEEAQVAELLPGLEWSYTEAAPAPLIAEAEPVTALPRTATPFPILALTGLIAAGAAGALRVRRTRA